MNAVITNGTTTRVQNLTLCPSVLPCVRHVNGMCIMPSVLINK